MITTFRQRLLRDCSLWYQGQLRFDTGFGTATGICGYAADARSARPLAQTFCRHHVRQRTATTGRCADDAL